MDVTWETHEVNLWLNNDQVLYNFFMNQLENDNDDEVAGLVRRFCVDVCEDFGSFCDLSMEQLDRVDWDYIVKENRDA